MSLKSFHIFFVTASAVLAFGFAAWAVWTHVRLDRPSTLMLGVASLLVGVSLVIYGLKVLRTLRRM